MMSGVSERDIPIYLPTLDRLESQIPHNLDVDALASDWLSSFANALARKAPDAILTHIHPDGWWRDLFALTWDLRSFHGEAQIKKFIHDRLIGSDDEVRFQIDPHKGVEASLIKRDEDVRWILVQFHFSTKVAEGRGVAYLVPPPPPTSSPPAPWQSFVIATHLEALKDHPERVGALRSFTPNHGKWEETRRREVSFEGWDPEVVIVGGGHSGLMLAARLSMLGVKALVVEKNERIGDNWRGRYEALCLHDVIWFLHFPYLPFPPTWPVYIPAKKLAAWLEFYADALELNVWTSTKVTSARRSDATGKWEVTVKNWKTDSERVLKTGHVVFATGTGGGLGRVPDVPCRDVFKGEVLHSTQFKTARDYVGKKVVVVGACTSGHDISADCAEHGIDVTMFQRSSTYVMSAKEGMPLYNKPLYWEGGPPIDDADRLAHSLPIPFNKLFGDRATEAIQMADQDILDKLASVGYQLNMTSGSLMWLAIIRGGGFYVDQRACQMIIDRKIKLKTRTCLASFTPTGLKFTDGSELDADVVVFATGYADPRESMRPILGEAVAVDLPRIWGLNDEGEINGCWRELGREGLWSMYGNFAWARYFSRLLALQIKARQESLFGERYAAS